MTEHTPTARIAMVTLDCADPRKDAQFWAALLGGDIVHADDDYGMVSAGGLTLGFGRLDGYTPPPWPDPDGRKQFHLDLAVADIPAAQARAAELGATVPTEQPAEQEGGTWRVLLDPSGHPFCLTDEANWG